MNTKQLKENVYDTLKIAIILLLILPLMITITTYMVFKMLILTGILVI